MGIRIHSAVIYGVQLTKAETKSFESFEKTKPRNWLIMRWVEEEIKICWKNRNKFTKYDNWLISKFFKFDKNNKCCKPYRPFWSGLSKSELKKVEDGWFEDLVKENFLKHGFKNEAETFENILKFPSSNYEDNPINILGYIQESNYARDVDYALVDIFRISGCKDKTIILKGTYPWECGTARMKAKNDWYTHNGENMLPDHYIPKNKKREILKEILWHTGTRESFIHKKKKIWDKYHGDLRPYKNYSCEGWWGSDFYFTPIDSLYKFISKRIPEIKYDIMKLQKFLCLYWG